MFKRLHLFRVCLTAHDGAAAAAPAASGTPQAGTQQPAPGQQATPGDGKPVVVYGKQATETTPAAGEKPKQTDTQSPAETPEQRQARFDQLVNGEFKDMFTAATQKIIDRRFSQTKTLESSLKAYDPLVDILSAKYDLKDKTPQALVKAIEQDSKFFEELAEGAGMTVEQFKANLALQRDNAKLKAQVDDFQAIQQREQRNSELAQQVTAIKAKYPNFDMMAEITNAQTGSDFADLLNRGVSVETAYQAVHFNDILGGAITAAGTKAVENVVNNIQAKGQRPKEAGAAPGPAVIVKQDPNQFTDADLEAIAAKVRRGEKVYM